MSICPLLIIVVSLTCTVETLIILSLPKDAPRRTGVVDMPNYALIFCQINTAWNKITALFDAAKLNQIFGFTKRTARQFFIIADIEII